MEEQEQGLERLYRISSVADWMRCSRASVYRILKSGSLKSIKVGGARMITHSQLVDYLEERKRQA
jgi:excisionase family DNA binding protein